MHVLEAADDLNVLGIGDNSVRSLGDRLQTAPAESIDRRAAGLNWEARHQSDGTGHVETLLALLLNIAQNDIFDDGRVDAAPLDYCADYSHSQIIGPDVAVHAFLGVGATDWRPASFNYDGGFHRRPF
jgi:hypothetical protein